jgi:lipopolysaccharide transport system ATP-binding protein
MSTDVLIETEGTGKKFCRSLKRSMLYAATDVASDLLGLPLATDRLRKDEFWAVSDVSFSVKRGECLGVIGANGAGKSTLLKLLSGIIAPDSGRITIRGRVGALIELGAGFHPMLTGRENIYISGALLGINKKEMERKFDEIVAFAELEEFIDTPVKFYSSGMYVRLGFAVCAHTDPDILLIDEVLAVGDNRFRARCTRQIEKSLLNGAAVIFVSHNMNEIVRVCDRTMWLDKGRIVQNSKCADTVGAYLLANDRQETAASDGRSPELIEGARLLDLVTCDAQGNVRSRFRTGEALIVHFDYEKQPEIDELTFSFALTLGDEKNYVSCHSPWAGFVVRGNATRGRVTLTIPELLLNTGFYLLNVGLWNKTFKHAYDWRWGFRHVEVRNDNEHFTGRFFLPHHWTESAAGADPGVCHDRSSRL